MAGQSEDSLLSIPEQFEPILESEIIKYLTGALVGGVIGDIIQEVVSGVIVEIIVSTFVLLGIGHLVINPPASGVGPGLPGVGPVQEVLWIGTIGSIAITVFVIWRVVFPRVSKRYKKRQRGKVLKAGLVAISAGVIFGGLFGLAAALVASSLGGIATIELQS